MFALMSFPRDRSLTDSLLLWVSSLWVSSLWVSLWRVSSWRVSLLRMSLLRMSSLWVSLSQERVLRKIYSMNENRQTDRSILYPEKRYENTTNYHCPFLHADMTEALFLRYSLADSSAQGPRQVRTAACFCTCVDF